MFLPFCRFLISLGFPESVMLKVYFCLVFIETWVKLMSGKSESGERTGERTGEASSESGDDYHFPFIHEPEVTIGILFFLVAS